MRTLRLLMGLVPLLVLGLAYHFLHSFFQQHPFASVWSGVQQIPPRQLIAAAVLTLISYIILTGYDLLGLNYLGRRLRLRQILPTSFMAFAFNNNLGMAGIAGSSIRYHNYSRWGLSAGEVLKIIVVVSSSYWIGFLTVGGISLTLHPLDLEGLPGSLPTGGTRWLGILLWIQVVIYLAFLGLRKNPFVLRGVRFRVPPFGFAGLQVLVSALDWVVVAAVLYSLLPADVQTAGVSMGFAGFLAIFCLSQIVAVFTHVPGGIGVLEAMLLHFLTSAQTGHEARIMAALIVFRIIYFFGPLLLALIVLVVTEMWRHGRKVLPKPGVCS